ncbi:MAG: hypothetical protein LBK29_03740 [Oscillospiraceae bacterium]|jgi:hypothetical protein|nr:hypothetical protein [Oscillospiraceae bacterium]
MKFKFLFVVFAAFSFLFQNIVRAEWTVILDFAPLPSHFQNFRGELVACQVPYAPVIRLAVDQLRRQSETTILKVDRDGNFLPDMDTFPPLRSTTVRLGGQINSKFSYLTDEGSVFHDTEVTIDPCLLFENAVGALFLAHSGEVWLVVPKWTLGYSKTRIRIQEEIYSM